MTSYYSVSNTLYPGDCGVLLQIPVVEDASAKIRLGPTLNSKLKIGTAFECTIEEAIQASDRHVFVSGKPDNPLYFINDWLNTLRWEISQLWDIDPTTSSLSRSTKRSLTYEHYLRSGELLAEGVAILFLTKRLGIKRQRFYFFHGDGPRPDFVFDSSKRYKRGIVVGKSTWALEVRSRKSQRNLHKDDRESLYKKKGKFDQAIAVYLMHGEGLHPDGTSRTRLHIADPPGNSGFKLSEQDSTAAAIHYYLTLTSQIGLWEYRDHLLNAAYGAKNGDSQATTMSFNPHTIQLGTTRQVNGQTFRGRDFNTLMYDLSQRHRTLEERGLIRRRALARIDAGDFGVTMFRGLSLDVLKLIENSDWRNLLDYTMEVPSEVLLDGVLREDGICELRHEVEPNSREADTIRQSVPNQ